MIHEPCEDCDYNLYPGHHEVGLIVLCEGEGYHFICRECGIHEVWAAPPNGFERMRFDGMIEDMVNSHRSDQLFVHSHEEEVPAVVRVPLWRRVVFAARVLKTKYVQVD